MTHDSEIAPILSLLENGNSDSIPLEIIVTKTEYTSDKIDEILNWGIQQFIVDKVIDYPDRKWGLGTLHPMWHIKKLVPSEIEVLKKLPSRDLALIRLLQKQGDSDWLGRMKVKDAMKLLENEGFQMDSIYSLWVEDWVDNHYEYDNDTPIIWCYLIPEYNKTEEYKRAEEEMNREADERAARKEFYSDAFDLADAICRILREHKDSLSKEEISKKLSWYYPKALDKAFTINLEDGDIELVKLPNGTEVYRIVASELD